MNVSFECDENEVSLEILSLRLTEKIFAFNNKSLKIYDPHISKNKVEFKLNNTLYTAFISADLNGAYDISINGSIFKVKRNDILFLGADYNHSNDDEEGSLFAPMPGKVIKVNVKKGDKVLFVDDINDSGSTFKWIEKNYKTNGANSAARFAVMTENTASAFGEVAYSYDEINKADEDVWLVYPYET